MNEKALEKLLEFIKSVGVPAAIAFFVLWRVDIHLSELSQEIRLLNGTITQVLTVVVDESQRRK